MRFCDWLTIDSFHPYFKSQKMDCLGIFPSEKTQLWLKNHRHNWKFTENSIKLSFSISPKNENLPEIEPLNEPCELEFYLGINDLNFQQYTNICDLPIFYQQNHFNISIDQDTQFPKTIQFIEGHVEKTDKLISLPTGFNKFGNLKIYFSNIHEFLVNCINGNSPKITFQAEDKAYSLFYAIKNNIKNKKAPNLIEEESKKATFSIVNVDNSEYIFFKSNEVVKLSSLNTFESYCYWVSDDENKTRFKVKTPNFSIKDLSKSPTYPQFPALIKEIKF